MITIPEPTKPWDQSESFENCLAAREPALIELVQKAEAAEWNSDDVTLVIVTIAVDYAEARGKKVRTRTPQVELTHAARRCFFP